VRTRSIWLFALVSCWSVSARATPAQSGDAKKAQLEALRELCESFRAERKIVGMVVAAVDDGEVVFEHGSGERDREAKLAAEPDTLFRLASVSKPVTATIAMQLVEERKLDLDAPVGKWVPDLGEPLAKLRPCQLLSHTSGIRHYAALRFDNGTTHRTTAEALALFAKDPLLFEPGTKFSYSTHAFTLAVAAIESASGASFVDRVRALAERAGARSLDCEVASESKPKRSALYVLSKAGEAVDCGPREDLSWKYGGGGLESTACDVARFADAVLRAKVVAKESRDRMWTRAKLADGSSTQYGLGWSVSANGKAVSHTGSQQGASSALLVLRDEGIAIAVLANTEGANVNDLVPKLREALTASR
jgi:serine beta-lactamase-like protein LACTB, mitochondrial